VPVSAPALQSEAARVHSRFWASTACACARALSRLPVGAAERSPGCPLLFVEGAGCTGALTERQPFSTSRTHSRPAALPATPVRAALRSTRMSEAALAAQTAALNARCAASPREAALYAATLRRTPHAQKVNWLVNNTIDNLAALVGLMLADGFSPNTVSPAGQSLLYVAAGHGSIDVLRVLLEAGAEANSFDSLGNTPLQTAIIHGKLACARELIPHTDLLHFNAGGNNALLPASSATSPKSSGCCCPTLRTTSMCAPSRNAPRLTLTVRTTARHYCSHARVGITPW